MTGTQVFIGVILALIMMTFYQVVQLNTQIRRQHREVMDRINELKRGSSRQGE